MSADFEILNPDGTSNHLNAVCELIARPFTNGGSRAATRLDPPQVEARAAAEPDHSVSPYLLRPLRSEVECLLKRYREGGKS